LGLLFTRKFAHFGSGHGEVNRAKKELHLFQNSFEPIIYEVFCNKFVLMSHTSRSNATIYSVWALSRFCRIAAEEPNVPPQPDPQVLHFFYFVEYLL